jgi:hypothetical protein
MRRPERCVLSQSDSGTIPEGRLRALSPQPDRRQ